MVVEKPISRIIMVEKELTTPLGIALCQISTETTDWDIVDKIGGHVRRKDRNKEEDCLGVCQGHRHLLLVERLVLDSGLIARNALHRNETLALVEKPGAGRGIRKQEPDHHRPNASCTPKLLFISRLTRQCQQLSRGGNTHNEEYQLPAFGRHVRWKMRNAHGDIRSHLQDCLSALKILARLLKDNVLTIPPHPRDELWSSQLCIDSAGNQVIGYLLPNALAERNLASRIPEAGHQSETPTHFVLEFPVAKMQVLQDSELTG